MQAGVFMLLLLGAIGAGILGMGVAKPVIKDSLQQSLRHGSPGHFRSHNNYSGK